MRQAGSGRPLRFFALLMGGWIAARMLVPGSIALPPQPLALASLPTSPPPARASSIGTIAVQPPQNAHTAVRAFTLAMAHTALPGKRRPAAQVVPDDGSVPVDLMDFISFSVAFSNRHYGGTLRDLAGGQTQVSAATLPAPLPAPLLQPSPRTPNRWSASGWLLWRDGSALPSDASVGRLGGSQAGVRLDFDLTPGAPARATAYARATSALQRPAAPEAALGFAFQPSRAVPISIAAERRIALGQGARNANAVMLVGGFGPTPIAPAVEAEGYAQTGMVGLRSRDAFIDGKFSLLTPIARSPIRIGASLSGGAQPQVERLDIGPDVQFRLPLPRVSARIGLEWRQRIAGNAAPASGLALTLATDF